MCLLVYYEPECTVNHSVFSHCQKNVRCGKCGFSTARDVKPKGVGPIINHSFSVRCCILPDVIAHLVCCLNR